jgi:oligopeptide transport system ATP-binding protein
VVAEVADRIAVMYAGRIVEHADVHSLYANPCHPYTRSLLESIPRVDTKGTTLKAIRGLPPSLTRIPSGCPFHPRCPYVFAPCPKELPPLVAPVEAAHPDACFLPWDRKVDLGKKRSIARLGDAA